MPLHWTWTLDAWHRTPALSSCGPLGLQMAYGTIWPLWVSASGVSFQLYGSAVCLIGCYLWHHT